jgi:multiple sugar transport system permease protein
VKRALTVIALVGALVVAIVPIAWMVVTTLKPNAEISQNHSLLPETVTGDNYSRLFADRDFGAFLRNSIGITALAVAVSLLLAAPMAYVAARFRLVGRLEERLGISMMIGRIVPSIVIIVPVYLLEQRLGLLDTWAGLIVVYAAFNLTFSVWMLEGFFREIPVDLEEAAMVDGDSRWRAFVRIVLPLAAPGLAATAIFATITTLNEFLFALVLTNTPSAQTLPAGTATLVGRVNIDWGAMAAAGVVGALPVVVFALLVQRHLVRGLTFGAVK